MSGVTCPLLTMMHDSLQSLDDGVHSWVVFLPQLQETSRDKGLEKGLTDFYNNPNKIPKDNRHQRTKLQHQKPSFSILLLVMVFVSGFDCSGLLGK